ncbi:hypothetical protein OPV22_030007 [Ensete ventricosum]|uniref:Uncharacterized protein n=1 Tax=Ensete ventricosum TaxID=4639 RepID=A0AAV8Q7R5_ENSVE|nr:hypothetical protein OPV22_030007 [Ensete ventricosum]
MLTPLNLLLTTITSLLLFSWIAVAFCITYLHPLTKSSLLLGNFKSSGCSQHWNLLPYEHALWTVNEVLKMFPMLYYEIQSLKVGKGAFKREVCLNEFDDNEELCLLPRFCHVLH